MVDSGSVWAASVSCGRGVRGEYFSLSRDSLSLLDFLFLVQLYSNQGVSCRNIGQEQLRVKQSCGARQTLKYDLDPMICIRQMLLKWSLKSWKRRQNRVLCRFSEFLIQLCIKNTFFGVPCRNITTMCRNIAFFGVRAEILLTWDQGVPGFSCRAIFGVCEEILIFRVAGGYEAEADEH